MSNHKPNVNLRIDEIDDWYEAMERDGFSNMATWVKWIVRQYLKSRKKS